MRGIRTDKEKERQVIELYEDPIQISSMAKVGKQLGLDLKTVWRILVRNNRPRRTLSEAKTIYQKTDFSENPVEQARLLGFMEDCGARYQFRQVRVATSTTHPALIILFYQIFGGYDHISRTPTYNKQTATYGWHFHVGHKRPSFDFLVEYKENRKRFLSEIETNGCVYDFIASLADAESWIGIELDRGYPRPVLSISNTNRPLLKWTQAMIGGSISSSSNGVYQLRRYYEEAVEVLRRLPVAHQERVASKQLILHFADNGTIDMEAFRAYEELRRRIDDEVRLCTMQARLEWIRKHGKPHKDDPDQTIPPN